MHFLCFFFRFDVYAVSVKKVTHVSGGWQWEWLFVSEHWSEVGKRDFFMIVYSSQGVVDG